MGLSGLTMTRTYRTGTTPPPFIGSFSRTRLNTTTAAAAPAAPAGPSVSPEARTALQAAMARYEPGGGYGQGVETALERGRTQAMSGGMQNLVSSGLAGTTIAGGLGKKYEQEVAAPARAQVEENRASAISSLQVMLAQMEQGGYQAGLSRSFQSGESALNRAYQSSFPTSTPATSYQPQRSQPPVQELSQPFRNLRGREDIVANVQAANTGPSTGPRTPGSYVGSINGQRWVYDQTGYPVREQ